MVWQARSSMAGQGYSGIPKLRFAVRHKCRFHLGLSLVKIEVISDDGRETFSDQEAAAKFAAGLNVAGVSCDTVFHFSDGTTATIRQKCDSEGVTSQVELSERR